MLLEVGNVKIDLLEFVHYLTMQEDIYASKCLLVSPDFLASLERGTVEDLL